MSTYTDNTGIEKIDTGAQSGTWGVTTNTNFDIIDRALNGVVSITLTGTTHTLTTNDGSTSDGQYKLLEFGGSLGATNTITIAPNDAEKIYFVRNNTTGGQDIVLTQGSGGNVTVANGKTKIVYADGAGSGAAVSDFTDKLQMANVAINGGAIDGAVIGGATPAAGSFTTITGSGDVTIDTNTLKVDTANNRVGILQAVPTVPLEVGGQIYSSSGGFKFPDSTVQTTAAVGGSAKFAVTTGSSNVYALPLSPALGSYTAGDVIYFQANFTNTASSTINVNSLGAKTIKTVYGDTLVGGEIVSGGIYNITYDGTDFIITNSYAKSRGAYVSVNSTLGSMTVAHDTWTYCTFSSGNILFDTSGMANATSNRFEIPTDAKAVLCNMMVVDSFGALDWIGCGWVRRTGFGSPTNSQVNWTTTITDGRTVTTNAYELVNCTAVFELPAQGTTASADPYNVYPWLYAYRTSGTGSTYMVYNASVTILE